MYTSFQMSRFRICVYRFLKKFTHERNEITLVKLQLMKRKNLQLMKKHNEHSMLSHVFHQKDIKLFTFPQKLFTECPCSNIE